MKIIIDEKTKYNLHIVICIKKHYKAIVNKTIIKEKRLAKKNALENLEKDRNNPRKFFKHCKNLKQGFKPHTLLKKMIRMIF